MLDDLRRSASEDLDEVHEEANKKPAKRQKRGMSPFERMVLAILLFMLVTVLGLLILIVSGRIVL